MSAQERCDSQQMQPKMFCFFLLFSKSGKSEGLLLKKKRENLGLRDVGGGDEAGLPESCENEELLLRKKKPWVGGRGGVEEAGSTKDFM